MHYIVNKQTKEHRVYDPSSLEDVLLAEFDSNWRLLRADENGWIEWGGGECPLPSDTGYEIKERTGAVTQSNGRAFLHGSMWRHGVGYPEHDIVAYRPACYHEQHDEPTAEEEEAFRMIKDKQREWDGACWPPAEGSRVEVRLAMSHDFIPGTVVATGVNGRNIRAAVKTDCGMLPTFSKAGDMVRPIRTAAQRAVEAMRQAVADAPAGSATESIYTAIREGRIPGVRLDD